MNNADAHFSDFGALGLSGWRILPQLDKNNALHKANDAVAAWCSISLHREAYLPNEPFIDVYRNGGCL